MRRKCYGLPVSLPYIVVTWASMFRIKCVWYDPPYRVDVFWDIPSVHDTYFRAEVYEQRKEHGKLKLLSMQALLSRFGWRRRLFRSRTLVSSPDFRPLGLKKKSFTHVMLLFYIIIHRSQTLHFLGTEDIKRVKKWVIVCVQIHTFSGVTRTHLV